MTIRTESKFGPVVFTKLLVLSSGLFMPRQWYVKNLNFLITAKKKNIQLYGQADPPKFDIRQYKHCGIPLAIFATEFDMLAPIGNARYIRDQIISNGTDNDILVYYQEYKGGHCSWQYGKNMDYLNPFVRIIKKYGAVNYLLKEKKLEKPVILDTNSGEG